LTARIALITRNAGDTGNARITLVTCDAGDTRDALIACNTRDARASVTYIAGVPCGAGDASASVAHIACCSSDPRSRGTSISLISRTARSSGISCRTYPGRAGSSRAGISLHTGRSRDSRTGISSITLSARVTGNPSTGIADRSSRTSRADRPSGTGVPLVSGCSCYTRTSAAGRAYTSRTSATCSPLRSRRARIACRTGPGISSCAPVACVACSARTCITSVALIARASCRTGYASPGNPGVTTITRRTG
jgi:hypothetical protein